MMTTDEAQLQLAKKRQELSLNNTELEFYATRIREIEDEIQTIKNER